MTAEGAYRLWNASQNVNLVFFQLLGCTNQLHHHKKHTKNAFASTFCWWRLVITIAFTSMSSICNMFTGDNFWLGLENLTRMINLTWTWIIWKSTSYRYDDFDIGSEKWIYFLRTASNINIWLGNYNRRKGILNRPESFRFVLWVTSKTLECFIFYEIQK